MAEAPRSSFIPKQTKAAVSTRVHKKRRFNILGIISSVVLLSSLVFAGGTYFYHGYVEKQLVEQKQALAEERGRFNESDIASVRELDRKFAAAEYLLSQHLSPSKIFDALELTTKQTVQFQSFAFSQGGAEDVALTVQGATEEFKSVALQALAFGDERVLKDLVFTNLSDNQEASVESEEGEEDPQAPQAPRVNFSVSGSILPSLLSYDGRAEVREVPDTELPNDTTNGTSTEDVTGTTTESSNSEPDVDSE